MSNTLMGLIEFHQIHANLNSKDVILDVRNPDEFQAARIPQAINIPVTELAQLAHELKSFDTIYIHCKRGGRAKTAFETLKSLGHTNLVCIHDAGMDLWIEKGFKTEMG